METKSVSKSVKRLKETPYVRIAYTAMIASILLVASLAVMNPLNAASAGGGEIHATGTITSVIALPDVADRTVGDLFIQNRLIISTYTGTLEGKALADQALMDNAVTKKAASVQQVVFTGTLAGSEPGSFAAIGHIIGDRSACPCPPGIITFDATFVVVEGSGQGGLKGICGGGTSFGSGNPSIGFTTTYDYKLRFGKDCKANN